MLISRKAAAPVAVAVGLAVSLAACGSSSTKTPAGASSSSGGTSSFDVGAGVPEPASGINGKHEAPPTAHPGGTLKLLGAGDVDHLDPSSAYYTVSYTLLRAVTRQLVTYPNSVDPKIANAPVPDMAESVPTPSNGGKTYTFKIKSGVKWDIPGGAARAVTSADMIRGIKRICNPAQPSGAANYYTATIAGMSTFCDAFAKVKPDAASMKAYMDSHQISGLTAPDASTVVFNLMAPAGDFMNILALPFASAAPIEVENYIPDSPEYNQHFISDGPYKIDTYVPKQKFVLSRNAAWDASTDKVRHAYVDNIDITEGSDEVPVQQQLQTGDVNMEWDTTVPTAQLPGLKAQNDPHLSLQNVGATNPYVVFNLLSPHENGALGKQAVRKALQYCVAKQDIVQVEGGPDLQTPIDQILTPPILGYKKIDPYNNLNGQENATLGKKMLADAGYPNGLNLIYLYRNKGKAPAIATTLKDNFSKCGVNLNLKVSTPSDFYTKHLSNPTATKAGDWDLAGPGWNPDWQGNAARSFFVPLLDPRQFTVGTTNYGDYGKDNFATVTKAIDDALATTDPQQVADKWAALDAATMDQAPWIPLVTGKTPYYYGARTHNWVFFNFANNGDITNVWVS
ncbi:MAG TPA: ABC transporter substrate-binding protein [Mycobacteriales bacterium]|jgi:peptide/nickel transport system substrate-binding protein|nr:ABC transporter substrate-binding protein [Mycobacteriales bacterium]